MRLKEDNTKQKLLGAYYTPIKLANAMVKFLDFEEVQSVLEPSCGDGVFLNSLSQTGIIERINNIDAVEIENDEAEKVINAYQNNENVHVYNEDFFEFYSRVKEGERYDLILGNPPYIRYQYLTEEQRKIQSKILESHGMKANKLINAWVAFLVACVHLLSDNGKIAFVIPAEILQVAYAEDLRLFLSTQLTKITLITFEQLVFPDIEQEILVFLGEKNTEEKGIRIIETNNISECENLRLDQIDFQKMNHAKEKWTKYFISPKEIELIQQIRNDKRFVEFSDIGIINVGITTGDNKYFSINDQVCKEYNLEEITLPLIGRSSHAHGIRFTRKDWEYNCKAGKNARLILFPESIEYNDYPQNYKDYIQLGEKEGINKGYKCSIRDRWYIIPSVWVPDAFFLRRNNIYPKFVLNECGAVSTDTMHRMKFNPGVNPNNILLSYYNSISFAFTEVCGRSYGGGVLEILPGEMGNIMLPKIQKINSKLRDEVLKEIDKIVRSEKDIEEALDIVDNKILINELNIEPDWCKECRIIWRKLKRRRLRRGQ